MTVVATFYVIRKIGTELYLPQTKSGKGFTFTDPMPINAENTPRMFPTIKNAVASLKSWAAGPMLRCEDGEGGTYRLQPHSSAPVTIRSLMHRPPRQTLWPGYIPRNPHDFEVVPLDLVIN